MKYFIFKKIHILRKLIVILLFPLFLANCGGLGSDENTPYTGTAKDRDDRQFGESIFGKGGIKFLGGEDSIFGDSKSGGGPGIGVNSFLWRASLDATSFMPLSSADPFGGVIITDWYSPPESKGERFKMTVYILGKVLRADAIRVSLFRQSQDKSGVWIDTRINPKTISNLENRILERARQFKTAAITD